MKVGVLREDLERSIYKELHDINASRELFNHVTEKLVSKGFLTGDAQQLLIGNTALEFIGEIKLGAVANAIYETTKNEGLNIENYFDKEEAKEIRDIKLELEDDKLKLPITFSNMTQYAHDMWVGIIPIQQFVKLHQDNISTYNFETQRDPLYQKYKGTTIRKVNINSESVVEIASEITKGTYLYDDITLNILANGDEDFEFKKTGENIGDLIFKGGEFNLTDGAHRLKGAESALLTNPTIKGNFVLIITNFDTNKANSYILQKDRRNPIDKDYLESKDTENLNNEVVRNINESPLSDLRGLIVTDGFLLRQGEGVTLFSTMSKSIDRLWQINNRRDARLLSDYLIKFFNEIVGIFPEEFNADARIKNRNFLINHHNMIVYYLTIAKHIENREKWENILYDVLKSTDFSRTNPLWKETVLYFSTSNVDRRLSRVIRILNKNIKEVL